MSGLYIHIPFCAKKCAYCAFYSVASKDWKKQESFFQSLETEIKNLKSLYPDFLPETVFIGGGTPTVLGASQLETLLADVAEAIDLSCVTEYSCEANPGTLDPQKLAALRAGGVNRLSVGVQSFDESILKTLGRIHTAAEAEEAFALAREAEFKNINLDLIFGVPGQSLEAVERDLDCALARAPEHLAVYNLIYEDGTPLTASNPARLDEELEREMYYRIRERLIEEGFVHYEISNFAKPGFECLHNRLYWSGGEYFGAGPAAHSHWQGRRWANASNLTDYCANGPSTGFRISPRREFEETLDSEAKAHETLVMGLRLLEGVDVPDILWMELEAPLHHLEAEGLIVIEGRHVQLSKEALFVSDAVFAELV